MILLAPLPNLEPHGATLAGFRHGMKVEIVTPNRVSHLQRYGVTVRGNVTSVTHLISALRPSCEVAASAKRL
jgi:hypothetical protein